MDKASLNAVAAASTDGAVVELAWRKRASSSLASVATESIESPPAYVARIVSGLRTNGFFVHS